MLTILNIRLTVGYRNFMEVMEEPLRRFNDELLIFYAFCVAARHICQAVLDPLVETDVLDCIACTSVIRPHEIPHYRNNRRLTISLQPETLTATATEDKQRYRSPYKRITRGLPNTSGINPSVPCKPWHIQDWAALTPGDAAVSLFRHFPSNTKGSSSAAGNWYTQEWPSVTERNAKTERKFWKQDMYIKILPDRWTHYALLIC